MTRLLTIALALATPLLLFPSSWPAAADRTLPMHFELRMQGPGDDCAPNCETLISASGAITADTARHFLVFTQGRELSSATLAIDSDGGSVGGAFALGRDTRT